MKTYNNLYEKLTSYENLQLAFKRARKGKSSKSYVVKFESKLKENLTILKNELENFSYKPKPLKRFIVRDPKTRVIMVSDFRDRVVHHTVCNIIEPLFDKKFIFDSYANRKGKGVHIALHRFDNFKRKISLNGTKINKAKYDSMVIGYVLKADIKHYFDTIDHKILLNIIKNKIKDRNVILLIKQILYNHYVKENSKGMPLGNLTSQFFANVYLNELDQYVKHKLKVKYYIRYVDDFVIFHLDKDVLEKYKNSIDQFLREKLNIELHSEKSKIIPLREGINFLGFRVFYHYKLLKRSNLIKMNKKFGILKEKYYRSIIDYDTVYDFFEGWFAYAKHANTYKLRMNIAKEIEEYFPNEISTKELNRIIKTKNQP